jgi:nucleoid-associated protein YgaU
LSRYRIAIVVAALALATAAAVFLYDEELGQRGLPPQARLPGSSLESGLDDASEAGAAVVPSPLKPASDSSAPDTSPGAETTAGDALPEFEVVHIGSDCRAVIVGTAPPGALVIVKTAEGEIGRVTSAGDGRWTLVPDLALKSGTKALSLVALAPGRPPMPSEAVVVVVVRECFQPDAAAGGQVIVNLEPKAAPRKSPGKPQNAGHQLMQVPPGVNGDGKLLPALDTVDYDPAGALHLVGRAEAGNLIQVYLNNAPIGAALAEGDGRWRLSADGPVPPGVYTLRFDRVAETGTVLTPRPQAELQRLQWKNGGVVVQPGDTLWRLARKVYGDGHKQELIRRANRDRLGETGKIAPGMILFMPGVTPPSAASPGVTPVGQDTGS